MTINDVNELENLLEETNGDAKIAIMVLNIVKEDAETDFIKELFNEYGIAVRICSNCNDLILEGLNINGEDYCSNCINELALDSENLVSFKEVC